MINGFSWPAKIMASPFKWYGPKTQHFSAVKFAIGYEKNMSFLGISKSQKNWKKVEKSDWVPLITIEFALVLIIFHG